MSLIAEWLARHLFDRLPEGVPPLDDEDDDGDARVTRLTHISRWRRPD